MMDLTDFDPAFLDWDEEESNLADSLGYQEQTPGVDATSEKPAAYTLPVVAGFPYAVAPVEPWRLGLIPGNVAHSHGASTSVVAPSGISSAVDYGGGNGNNGNPMGSTLLPAAATTIVATGQRSAGDDVKAVTPAGGISGAPFLNGGTAGRSSSSQRGSVQNHARHPNNINQKTGGNCSEQTSTPAFSSSLAGNGQMKSDEPDTVANSLAMTTAAGTNATSDSKSAEGRSLAMASSSGMTAKTTLNTTAAAPGGMAFNLPQHFASAWLNHQSRAQAHQQAQLQQPFQLSQLGQLGQIAGQQSLQHSLAFTSLTSCPPHVNVNGLQHSLTAPSPALPNMGVNANNNAHATTMQPPLPTMAMRQPIPQPQLFQFATSAGIGPNLGTSNNSNAAPIPSSPLLAVSSELPTNPNFQLNCPLRAAMPGTAASLNHQLASLRQWSSLTALNSSTSKPSAAAAAAQMNAQAQCKHNTQFPQSMLDASQNELRYNFLQSQISHGGGAGVGGTGFAPAPTLANLVSQPVNASQHYGMAVNGFHPQVNAQMNPVLPMPGSISAPTSSASASSPRIGGGVPSLSHSSAHSLAAVAMTQSTSSSNTSTATSTAASRVKSSPALIQTSKIGDISVTKVGSSSSSSIKKGKGCKERNEREQQRAQKITTLIDQLRVSMQNDGWKQEMKSKYQTLSECKDYMKFLQNATKEKEADIEHTKKIVEEKALQESRSDPESIPDSVASSLTAPTARSSSPCSSSDNEESNIRQSSSQKRNKNRKRVRLKDRFQHSHDASSKKSKSSKRSDNEDAVSSVSSSEDGDSPGGKNISLDKMSSSVSALTENNRNSSDVTGTGATVMSKSSTEDNAKCNSLGGSSTSKKKMPNSSRDVCQHTEGENTTVTIAAATGEDVRSSSSSISSTAAVVRGGRYVTGSQKPPTTDHNESPNAALMAEAEKQRAQSSSSSNSGKTPALVHVRNCDDQHQRERKKKRGRGFDWDYRKVFLKSNVPQLIATLSGRIVVCNDFFLNATGLNKRELKRLTIFSIVQSSQLSELYKMVAKALASPKKGSEASELKKDEWQAITLKCSPFSSKQSDKQPHHPHPLFMTVALMADDDLQQRCFHCIFTDSPGPVGSFGRVTPELLALLFTNPAKKKNEESNSSGSSKKRQCQNTYSEQKESNPKP